MELKINDNVFWVLFWLILGSCTAVQHHDNVQVRLAAIECEAEESTDEDKQ